MYATLPAYGFFLSLLNKCNDMIYQKNISLNDKNWFRTGGYAQYYVEPRTIGDFQEAVLHAQKNQLSLFILGEGANILISDEGFNGLVIRPQLMRCQINDDMQTVTVGSGCSMQAVIDYCLDNNLIGLEEFSGIPGTIGGAIYINLHYFSFLIEHFLISAKVISKLTGEIIIVEPSWFNFGYNESTLQQEDHYLVSATFKVKKVTDLEAAYAKGRRDEIIRHRQRRYPKKRTCGSFFRNFFPHEVEQQNDQMKFVAYYLDRAGVRGTLSYGGARVSPLHANMIVTSPGAITHDVIQLARLMQQRVFDQFGLIAQPECRLIGFDENPLCDENSIKTTHYNDAAVFSLQ